MKRQIRGFTLVEVMVVVAILAILAAIALPAYQSHIEKTHLAAAKNNLVDIAAQMSRNKLLNNGHYTFTGLNTILTTKNSDSSSRYDFIAGPANNINNYYVYLRPRQRNFTKSLYITGSGTVFECKSVNEAKSKSSSCVLSSR